MRQLKRVCFSVVLLLASANALGAQQGTIELGIDTGITITDPEFSESVTTLGVPEQRIRSAAFFTDAVSLETSFSFNLVNSDGVTTSALQLALGPSFHLPSDPTGPRLYLAPFAALTHFNTASNTSFTQMAAGGLLGVKLPLAQDFGLRIETSYARAFETDDLFASNNFRVILGLSALIR